MTRSTAPTRRTASPALAVAVALAAVLARPAAAEAPAADLSAQASSVPTPAARTAEADDFAGLLPEPLVALAQWPCLDAPGCDGAARAATAAQPRDETPEATAIPVPAALGLLGFAMALLALVLRRGRPTA